MATNQTIDIHAYSSNKNVGTWTTTSHDITVYNGNEEVTDNYEIEPVYGKLTITKRPITVVFDAATKVYDGTNSFNPNYNLDLETGNNLVEGQTIVDAYNYSSSQNVGTWTTTSHNITIYNGNEEVTDNYEIEPVYGKLTITKRPITVVFDDATKVYDGTNIFNPNYNLDLENGNNLVEGQTIVDAYNYSSSQNVGIWTTTSHYITIYNGNEEVTDNYEIDTVYGNLTITKRPITVVFEDATKVYDGTNIFNPNYNLDLESSNNLVEGQTINLTVYSSSQNVGTWNTINHEMTIYDGIEDVTDNYEIDTVYGNLTITKRPITVVFNDTSKVYDGTNVFKPNYNLDLTSGGNNLVEGQTIDLTAYSSSQNIGIWTTINHEMTIYDGIDDVTNNYDINSVYGYLTITKRPITIDFYNTSKVYDGTNVFKPQYGLDVESVYDLVEGQEIHDVIVHTVDSNWGDSKTVESFNVSIMDNNSNDVSENYEITPVYGTFKINKRAITIDFYDATKVYDGTNVFKPQYGLDLESVYDLVEGQIINDAYVYSVDSNWGDSKTVESFEVIITDNNSEDVSENYEIIPVYGKLTITKRLITVVFNDTSKVYDGTNVFKPQYDLDLTSGGNNLVEGQIIDLTAYSSNKNVGSWTTTSHDITIYDGIEDVTTNYEIDTVYGNLTITKRPITVVFNDTSKVYDGTNVFKPNYNLDLTSGYELVEGQIIDLTAYSSSQNVGTWNTINHEMTIYDENEDVTNNYKIDTVYGNLTITKRPITIDFYDTTKVYDGTNDFTPQYGLDLESVYDLVDSQIISDAVVYTVDSNWGDSKTVESFNVSIMDNNSNDVSENYEITPVYGNLTITKRPITVIFDDATKVYDGTNIFTPIYSLDLNNGNNLVEGQIISEANVYTSDSNWGDSKTVESFNVSIMNNNSEDVSDNYEISPVYGNLTITKRYISLVFEDAQKIYDGTNIFDINSFTFVSGTSLATNQMIDIRAYSSNKNVGTWNTINHEMTIYDENEDVTNNYKIDTVYGNLTITKRPITVVFNDASKVYDGNNVFTPNYNLDLTSGGYDLVDGQTIDLTAYSSSQNVGTWNTINHEMTIYDGIEDVTNNYDINSVYGYLTITKRPITIDFYDTTKVYDETTIFKPQYGLDLESGYDLVDSQIISDAVVYTADSNWGDSKTVESFNVSIMDNNSNDVSENYEITPVYSTLKITKRPITIDFYDTTKVYDGTTSFTPNYNLDLNNGDNLVEGQVISDAYNYSSSPNVGTWKATSYDITISDGNEDVTNNYDLTPIYGNLTITTRHITVDFNVTSKDYDGTNVFKPSYNLDLTSGGYDLVEGQIIDLTAYSSSPNVGTWNTINHEMTIYDGDEDVTNNYEIDPVYSNLTITKRPITVVFNDTSKGYDGTNVFTPNYNLDLTSGYDLVEGHTIDLTAYSSSSNVGTWTTINHEMTIYDGIEDVTNNYDINTVYSNLTITKRQIMDAKVEEFKSNDDLPNIEIISYDAMKQYDGSPLSKDEYYIYGNLAPEHQVVIINDTEITNIGTIRNKFSSKIVDKNTGEDVSYLYNIRQVYGDLVIVPNDERTVIEIKPFASKKVYDGITLALHKDDFWIPSNNLPEGYTIDLEFDNTIKDAGLAEVSINENSIVIYDENGQDVTSDFKIVTYTEVLEVTKREIEVKTMSAQKVYDGKELINQVYSISKGSLAPGQAIEIIWPDSGITEVGTLENEINDVIIRGENGNDVTKNYYITKNIGTLEIYKE